MTLHSRASSQDYAPTWECLDPWMRKVSLSFWRPADDLGWPRICKVLSLVNVGSKEGYKMMLFGTTQQRWRFRANSSTTILNLGLNECWGLFAPTQDNAFGF